MKLTKAAKRITCFLLCVMLSFNVLYVRADAAEDENTAAGQNVTEAENLDLMPLDEEETESPDAEMTEDNWRYQDGERIDETEDALPDDTISIQATETPTHPEGTRLGIDVSEHNSGIHNHETDKTPIDIDWEKVKADGVDFAIIRCGWGMNYTSQDDLTWERNVSECERLGIPYGVYIYSYADSVERAKSEAEHVLRLIEGHNLSYPVFYDMEDNSTLGADLAEIAKTFCGIIEDAGYPVGVYANLNWWNNYLTDECFDNWYKWVAQYYTTCNYKGDYTMWQFTSSGKVDGITGACDMNWQIGYPNDHGYIDPFQDVTADSWYADAVSYVYNKGLMKGLEETVFGPDQILARAQFAVIIHRFEGKPVTTYSDVFPDVKAGTWYMQAVLWANSEGIITGYDDTKLFGVADDITREQMATMMYRYALYKGYDVSEVGELDSFADGDKVNDFAKDAIKWCIGTGIITGKDGLIAPQDHTNRAECATIIMRFMQYYEQ